MSPEENSSHTTFTTIIMIIPGCCETGVNVVQFKDQSLGPYRHLLNSFLFSKAVER